MPEGTRPRERYWLHGLLLLVTCFTTLVVGARMEFNFLHNLAPFAAGDELMPFFPLEWIFAQPSRLLLGIPFSATLLTILLAHEMGHYLYCRYYGVRATLPFFIPAPTLIGTLGAVIRIKGRIRSRAALFDIGIAGPIAGFVVAIVTLAIALTFSKPLAPGIGPSDLRLGFPADFSADASGVGSHRPRVCDRGSAAWPRLFASDGDRGVGGDVCDCIEPAAEQPVGRRAHCLCAGSACTSRDLVDYGGCPFATWADQLWVVVLGRGHYCYQRFDLEAGAGFEVSGVAAESVGLGRDCGCVAVADFYGFAFSDLVACARMKSATFDSASTARAGAPAPQPGDDGATVQLLLLFYLVLPWGVGRFSDGMFFCSDEQAISISRRRSFVSSFFALITHHALVLRYHAGLDWKNSQAF